MCAPSLHGLSISSCPTRVPALAAVDNGLLYGTVGEINPFLPEWLWPWCLITEIVTLPKKSGYCLLKKAAASLMKRLGFVKGTLSCEFK